MARDGRVDGGGGAVGNRVGAATTSLAIPAISTCSSAPCGAWAATCTARPLPVEAQITRRERGLAEAFVQRVGNPARALSVLVRYQAGEQTAEEAARHERDVKQQVKDAMTSGKSLDVLRDALGEADTHVKLHVQEVLRALSRVAAPPESVAAVTQQVEEEKNANHSAKPLAK